MSTTTPTNLDLVFERVTSLTPEQIWQGWTDPQTLPKWFCPKPWNVSSCRLDLRPGGQFFTVMRSPEGQEFPNQGCYLEIQPKKRLIWTNALLPGYRPAPQTEGGFCFTADLTLEATSTGTLYKVILHHQDEKGRKAHEQMGFQEGWGKAFDQLIELMRK